MKRVLLAVLVLALFALAIPGAWRFFRMVYWPEPPMHFPLDFGSERCYPVKLRDVYIDECRNVYLPEACNVTITGSAGNTVQIWRNTR
jgi:hypothetical protein